MKVKLEDGRIKDVALTEVTAENYIVPESDREKRMYHVIIEVKKFNADTGARLSKPRLQKFGRKYFESAGYEELRKQGYSMTIVWNPNEYIAEQNAQAKKSAQQKQEEADAKRKAEIEQAVAVALARQEKAHKAEIEKAVQEALAKAENKDEAPKRGRSKAKTEGEDTEKTAE